MLNNSKYLDLLEAAAGVSNPAEMKNLTRKFVASMGYEIFSVAYVVPDGAQDRFIGLYDLPEKYLDIFFDLPRWRTDPVMQHCKRRFTPISWGRETYLSAGCPEKWEEMAPHGLQSGVAVAQHLPMGRHVFVGFERPGDILSESQQDSILGQLQLFSAAIIEPLSALLDPGNNALNNVSLSPTERDCLRWAMEGKTASETAQIMGLSHSWTSKVLSTALQKLDSVTKTQAVVKALQLRLL